MFGNQALDSRDDHTLHYPIQRGILEDESRLQDLLTYIFENELGLDSKSMNVLMTDSPLSSKDAKNKIAQLMLNHFGVKSFALMNTAVLSLFSTGSTTGLVAEVGEGVTYTVPVFEGYALPHALYTMDVSGQDVTNKLMSELLQSYPSVTAEMYQSI